MQAIGHGDDERDLQPQSNERAAPDLARPLEECVADPVQPRELPGDRKREGELRDEGAFAIHFEQPPRGGQQDEADDEGGTGPFRLEQKEDEVKKEVAGEQARGAEEEAHVPRAVCGVACPRIVRRAIRGEAARAQLVQQLLGRLDHFLASESSSSTRHARTHFIMTKPAPVDVPISHIATRKNPPMSRSLRVATRKVVEIAIQLPMIRAIGNTSSFARSAATAIAIETAAKAAMTKSFWPIRSASLDRPHPPVMATMHATVPYRKPNAASMRTSQRGAWSAYPVRPRWKNSAAPPRFTAHGTSSTIALPTPQRSSQPHMKWFGPSHPQ